ncbi:MAG: hypothetical protein ACLT3D_03360 [Lawsonibacter sp.]
MSPGWCPGEGQRRGLPLRCNQTVPRPDCGTCCGSHRWGCWCPDWSGGYRRSVKQTKPNARAAPTATRGWSCGARGRSSCSACVCGYRVKLSDFKKRRAQKSAGQGGRAAGYLAQQEQRRRRRAPPAPGRAVGQMDGAAEGRLKHELVFDPGSWSTCCALFWQRCAAGPSASERERRSKSAGIRTLIIVALSAALMMVVSKYGFFDVIGLGESLWTPRGWRRGW